MSSNGCNYCLDLVFMELKLLHYPQLRLEINQGQVEGLNFITAALELLIFLQKLQLVGDKSHFSPFFLKTAFGFNEVAVKTLGTEGVVAVVVNIWTLAWWRDSVPFTLDLNYDLLEARKDIIQINLVCNLIWCTVTLTT